MDHPTTVPPADKPRLAAKPAKPYPDFPLYAHKTRRWAKRIRGTTKVVADARFSGSADPRGI